ncbi:MAG: serine/threonine protein kinase [Verrucomicrobiales bacterium]|nr:serine/threonine protein kinase [Verrucomicrobiales bacterium]
MSRACSLIVKKPFATEMELFTRALELPWDARAAFLQDACAGDTTLLHRIDLLIQAHEAADGVLPDQPLASESAERPGTQIGRYKLLEQIGEGGFGVVWMAEQEEPVRRKVALKIIKLGMDTRQVIARFEVERQALALMDHPHIAKVFDAGATETGRPYFVMELVRGVPITEFCDQNHLSIRQRLEAFVPVCHAIQHAHQKGVIHRDLKPSNILVTLDDGVAHPMVIDFGVAKAINHRLTEKTLYTSFAQMIGTPAYMSPEQAEMSRQDVDTRSDIYSLGILLYELLTGTTPFPEARLREAGFEEIRRIIREEEPERPSTRVSTMRGEVLARLARNRESRPEALGRFVRGDLDWIVMKALEKDRSRRYGTASELAADLARHLHHEPVLASPPRLRYQLGKFVRRHRTSVIAAAAVTMVLVVAVILSTLLAMWALKAEKEAQGLYKSEQTARQQADQERERANVNAAEAARQAEEAKKQNAIAEGVLEFLKTEILGAGNAYTSDYSVTPDLTLKEVLARAAQHVEENPPDEPLVEASIRVMFELMQNTIGSYADALNNLRRAHELLLKERGPDHVDTLEARKALGWALSFRGTREQREEAEQLLREAYDGFSRTLGEADPRTIDSMLVLGLHFGNHDYNLSEGGELLRDAYALHVDHYGPDHVRTLHAGTFLANFLLNCGCEAEARAFSKELLSGFQKRFGNRDVRVVNMMTLVARDLWRWDEDVQAAKTMLKTALPISRELMGDNYPTDVLQDQLIRALLAEGSADQALTAGQILVDSSVRTLGPDHPTVQDRGRWIAGIRALAGDWRGTAEEFERQRALGIVNEQALAYEMLARCLAGDTDGVAPLWSILRKRVETERASSASAAEALVLLMLPCTPNERDIAIATAERAQATETDEITREILASILAFRQGLGSQAQEALVTLLGRVDLAPPVACVAEFVCAVISQQLGHTAEARKAAAKAKIMLDLLLRPGEISFEQKSWGDWTTLGCCLVIRQEAEEFILGKAVSGKITVEFLATARKRWQPVEDLLQQADRAARHQDYTRAGVVYSEVLEHPLFDFVSASMRRTKLDQAMGTVFVLTGDLERYDRLCRTALDPSQPRGAVFVEPLLLSPTVPSNDLKQQALGLVQAYVDRAKRRSEGVLHPWAQWIQGAALYRNGQPEKALTFLEPAMRCSREPIANIATALGALAAHMSGDNEKAEEYLTNAEKSFDATLEIGGGVLRPTWRDDALIEVFLREARHVIREGRSGESPP